MIRRLILAVLTVMLLLAAGLMAANLVFRHQTPTEFAQATDRRPVALPCDEAAHFEAQTEWWYYTGFLTGEDSLDYGFELVFFKAYLPPEVRIGNVLPLSWVANPLYFAHLAVSDLPAKEHVFSERTNFPEFWTAGARQDRYEVWNGDWRAWGDWRKDASSSTCYGEGRHHLRAEDGRYALRLSLEPAKPPALHGPTGAGVVDMGQAGTSYYYSLTDLEGAGFLWVDGERYTVRATAWMDHQWGSWDSHGGFAGWDWFSLRLDDGSEVMLFEFRDQAGNVQSQGGGTWIAADGSSQHLAADDYAVDVLDHWTSPDTGADYPVRWRVTVPDRGLDVTVEAAFPEQEMPIQLGPVYWEGAVTVDGSVSGAGFVEMTGYVP